MYQRDIITQPKKIARNQFVDDIFDLGLRYELGYDTLISAVQLGDKYVDSRNKYYSNELIHATVVLISKYNEDYFYGTEDALNATENKYVVLLEWELFEMENYCIKINNFITFIGKSCDDDVRLSSEFWDLSKNICQDKYLLSLNPQTILCASLLLYKHNKLKAIKDNKQRLFEELIVKIAKEYEVGISNILTKYIALKS